MIPINEQVGADIGNGFSTLIAGRGNSTKVVNFRSTYLKITDEALANYKDSSGFYIVGEEAIKIGAPQRPSTDSNYYTSERFRILLCYGLQQLGVKNPAVMIGLPVENFAEIKKRMRDHVRSYEKFNIGFTFNNIMFCEQPYGALCNPDYKIAGEPVSLMKADLRLVLVDVGDGTTDARGFYKGRPLDQESVGRSYGVHEIHEEILRGLKEKHTIDSDTTTHDIDQCLRLNKEFVCRKGSKEVSLNLRELPSYKKGVQNLISKVNTLVSDTWPSFNKIDYIVFAGGFLELVSIEEINKSGMYPESKCLVSEKPSIAIAQGLKTFLNILINQKLKETKNEASAQ